MQTPKFWDFEGSHPNIATKDLREGPGGVPALTAFDYLWKAVGEHGEEVEDLMAGELTREELEGILETGRGGQFKKRSRMVADLEDGLTTRELLFFDGLVIVHSVSRDIVPRPQKRVDHFGRIIAIAAALDDQDGEVGVCIRESRRHYTSCSAAWRWSVMARVKFYHEGLFCYCAYLRQ